MNPNNYGGTIQETIHFIDTRFCLLPYNIDAASLCFKLNPLQVPRRFIGSDAFQETPTVEVTRQITKHNYLVMDIKDIPRIMKEAFYIARTGRPGPVLVDIPKDIQQALSLPNWDAPMAISGYMRRLPSPPSMGLINNIISAIHEAKSPVSLEESFLSVLHGHSSNACFFFGCRSSTAAVVL